MRLFLALSPPDDLRQRLAALADALHAECGGRCVVDTNLHLTLAFLGEQSNEQARVLSAWLRTLRVPPGDIRLDHLGHFHRPGIVWIGSQQVPESLRALQVEVSRGLTEMGIDHQPRHFQAHVTLLRKAERAPIYTTPDPTWHWSYTRVDLVQSTLSANGSHYRCLASTPSATPV